MKQFILNALILWSTSLVPYLLPIMIISRLLIGSNLIYRFLRPFSFLCKKMLHLSPAGSYALLLGFCCGYPIGVKTLADLRSEDAISPEEAHYLANFINNVSPGFLIACVCHDLLKAPGFAIPCMVMVYGAAMCYGVVNLFVNDHCGSASYFPDMTMRQSLYDRMNLSGRTPFLTFLDTSIEDSITQMLKIGGYMVLFSVLSFFVCHLPALSAITRASLAALLEISLGCQLLVRLSVPLFWRYLLIVVTLTFGGLCSAFQSASYLRSIGFSLKNYIKTKAMTAVIALGLYLIYLLPSIGSGI